MVKRRPARRQRAERRGARVASAVLIVAAALSPACGQRPAEPQTHTLVDGSDSLRITFVGEVDDDAVFGPGRSLLDQVRPLGPDGRPRGRVAENRPGWLRFELGSGRDRRDLLVAKRPLMNMVSWNDIARAGAALGRYQTFAVESTPAEQGRLVKGAGDAEYSARLPICGEQTFAARSEWNALIGGVHEGDMDFRGPDFGWIERPYGDEDLKVGYHGSLTWCQDSYRGSSDRVARGYFFVSRIHAAQPDVRTDRLQWRPVLERRQPTVAGADPAPLGTEWSPSGRVGFDGVVSSERLFGPGRGISDQLPVDGGQLVEHGRPDWLAFRFDDGTRLLVAAKPVKHSLSWASIARAGAALGDGSRLRIGWKSFTQGAEVRDVAGQRYRVRLIGCGRSTRDAGSEWNALIGGVHRGDADFAPAPRGPYAWLREPLDDLGLHVGVETGGATWCRDTLDIAGKTHGVNRGYLTVSRFHATEIDFDGAGFGWRPVLVPIGAAGNGH